MQYLDLPSESLARSRPLLEYPNAHYGPSAPDKITFFLSVGLSAYRCHAVQLCVLDFASLFDLLWFQYPGPPPSANS